METTTTIQKMLSDGQICVPVYQRAYSWETPVRESARKTHTDVFFQDLLDYRNSKSQTPYYFGHFIFEQRDGKYYIIDGQQRLTTISIFIAVLLRKIGGIRDLNEIERECYEDMLRRNSRYRFSTVVYDNQLFKDYVIDRTIQHRNDIDTVSGKRIVDAYDYFIGQLSDKDESFVTDMLAIIASSMCTTHVVSNEAEAIQMFIFQNNRGKRPSNLEIIKAQFLYCIHLLGVDETASLTEEINRRFESIYKSISSIENNIDEDDVLSITLKIYFNSLWEESSIDRINKQLADEDPIEFIRSFTHELAISFNSLKIFFAQGISNDYIHSLHVLGTLSIVYPFILKAYKMDISEAELNKLCQSLESLVLRHKLIGTRADLRSRLNNVYVAFNKDITPIIERIDYLKETDDYWWAHWNNEALIGAIQGGIDKRTARFILWKYENHLIQTNGQNGYRPMRYTDIESPELEHIAPKTRPDVHNCGYGKYTEKFINESIECLGNYMLISKSHNCSIGNTPFKSKLESYTHLAQQRELLDFLDEGNNVIWNKDAIARRHKKITDFIISNL